MKVKNIILYGMLRLARILIVVAIGYWLLQKVSLATDYSIQELGIGIGVFLVGIFILGVIPEEKYYKFDSFISKIPLLGSIYATLVNLSLLIQPQEEDPNVYWVQLQDGVYSLGILMNPKNTRVIHIDENTKVEVCPLIFPVAFGILARVEWIEKPKLIPAQMNFRQAMMAILSGGNVKIKNNS